MKFEVAETRVLRVRHRHTVWRTISASLDFILVCWNLLKDMMRESNAVKRWFCICYFGCDKTHPCCVVYVGIGGEKQEPFQPSQARTWGLSPTWRSKVCAPKNSSMKPMKCDFPVESLISPSNYKRGSNHRAPWKLDEFFDNFNLLDYSLN